MKYVLENDGEAARLERQSQADLYDPMAELNDFEITQGQSVLDAGCGSGIVARALVSHYPGVSVIAVDASEARIAEAKKLAGGLTGIEFRAANLTKPVDEQFDRIVCRFVLEHMGSEDQTEVVRNLVAALKPGGKLRLIDIDGYLFNLFPTTPLLDECLNTFRLFKGADLFVGRKLAKHLVDAKLQAVTWRIQTMAMNEPSTLAEEIKLITERFAHTLPAMAQILGSEDNARAFQKEYLEILGRPGSTLFYNKFIATGQKAPISPKNRKLKAL